MRLLIVEDDDRSGRYLVRGLSESGHIVDRANEGDTGLAMALEGSTTSSSSIAACPAWTGSPWCNVYVQKASKRRC